MSDDAPATLHVTFRVPSSLQRRTGHTIHERAFEDIPESVAQTIVNDFARYSNGSTGARQRTLYRYEPVTADPGRGDEILLPIDFGEVLALAVVTPDGTREQTRSDGRPAS